MAAENPRRLVIADDDPSIRELLVEVFKLEGYEVHAFARGHDAAKAILALGAQGVHAVISDIMGPGGFLNHIAPALDAAEGEAPLIIMTAGLDPEKMARDELQAAGFRGPWSLILKPFDLDTLVSRVDNPLPASQVLTEQQVNQE